MLKVRSQIAVYKLFKRLKYSANIYINQNKQILQKIIL
jgi:hypothetical protein